MLPRGPAHAVLLHRPSRRTAPAATCPFETPVLSPKIPSLEKSTGCPKALYALAYVDTEVGTGELALPRKYYTVHYTGYLPDGSKFDSSFDHPGAEPITFPYGARQVIPGWDTGFEGMHVGGKRRLFIPYQLAYGEAGRPPVIPAKAELIFDVQLVAMSDTPPAPKAAPVKPETTAPSTPLPAGTAPPARPAAPAEPPATTRPATPPPTQSTTPGSTPQPTAPRN